MNTHFYLIQNVVWKVTEKKKMSKQEHILFENEMNILNRMSIITVKQ